MLLFFFFFFGAKCLGILKICLILDREELDQFALDIGTDSLTVRTKICNDRSKARKNG